MRHVHLMPMLRVRMCACMCVRVRVCVCVSVNMAHVCMCNTADRGAEQALGRLAYEMAGLARDNPHAGAHLATAASHMLALYR